MPILTVNGGSVNAPATSLLDAVSVNSTFSLKNCVRNTVNSMGESKSKSHRKNWLQDGVKPNPRRLCFSNRRTGKQKRRLRYSRGGSGESRDLPIHSANLLLRLLALKRAITAMGQIRKPETFRRLILLRN